MDRKNLATPSRESIGTTVRGLRKGQGLSQGDLGRILGLSQSSLSEIELGKVSLSAEQFIQVLKFFNVPVSQFDPAPGNSGRSIQKALAAHGAFHLVEDPDLLPSESLARVDSVIRETLVSGENPRAVTALAPVIIRNIGQINLHRLFVVFKEFHLENRYGWLVDNILGAIACALKNSPPRKEALELSRAAHVLQDHRDQVYPGAEQEPPFEDWLGIPAASPRTKHEILLKRSELSRRWKLLTTIQVEDFARAIEEGHVAHTH